MSMSWMEKNRAFVRRKKIAIGIEYRMLIVGMLRIIRAAKRADGFLACDNSPELEPEITKVVDAAWNVIRRTLAAAQKGAQQ